MPPLEVIAEPVTVHLSLNVPDLGRAVEFYSVLFGTPPAKRYDDYAKFEVADPPLVFSLVPQTPGPGGSLSHLGLRVSGDDAIRAYRDRLEAAGVCTAAQDVASIHAFGGTNFDSQRALQFMRKSGLEPGATCAMRMRSHRRFPCWNSIRLKQSTSTWAVPFRKSWAEDPVRP